jgi:membrane-bound lytic murein transglycosylase B
MSALTGVPARALEAYAFATAKADAETPECRLNWSTLAGVGYVESLNGADGGGLARSGRPHDPIYGVALTGVGDLAAVPDSDGGLLDGDAGLDRAVGPLQFLPSTWQTWGTDGDGDGLRDPQDIDDASLAAARYLCVSGDLSTAAGWTAAVLSYNHSGDYLASVYQAADQIAARS